MKSSGVLIVLSGPAGVGKGTICSNIVEKDENIFLSVSATTRAPRGAERDGIEYFFKSKDEFESMIERDELLEYASFCDNYYGTPKKTVMDRINSGEDVILEIEVQGAFQVKEKFPEAVLVFILPPSFEELKNRLVGRGTETPDVVEKRLTRAEDELKLAADYDYIIVNSV
ncbi:MAG: guanylate kinase [Clostridia bacterium]|nr:guanylate kinase [Clostridia bacterium]